jgi:sorbitol-specific phosphotransferase system component IIC
MSQYGGWEYLNQDRFVQPFTQNFWTERLPRAVWCTVSSQIMTYVIVGIVAWLLVGLITYVLGVVIPTKYKNAISVVLIIFTWVSLFGISCSMYNDCIANK